MARRRKRKTEAAAEPENWRNRAPVYQVLLLSATAFALYAYTLSFGWATDDEYEVLQDELIRKFANLPGWFEHSVWFFARVKADNYYRPLKLVAYSIEYHLFGFRPVYWHLVNVLANVAVVLAIYLLVSELASSRLAFWTAVLFAFHAIHVEAIAWVSAGNDLFCGLVLVLSLWLYRRARLRQEALAATTGPPARSRVMWLYCGSVVLFFAGVLFKETAITFPAVILSYDFFFAGESWREAIAGWRRYVGYLAALGVYLAMRMHALQAFAPQTKPWRMTALDMAYSVPVLAAKYVWASLVPVDQNYWHVYHPVRSLGLESVCAAAVCVFLIWATFRLRRSQPLLSFALAWFGLTLIPALDIPKVGLNVFADRYLYIPSFGFCVLAAWGWVWLRERGWRLPKSALAPAGLVCVLIFYSTLIVQRLPDWRDGQTLILKTAQQSPDSPQIVAYVSELYKDRDNLPEALRYAKLAVKDDPSDSYFHDNLGEVYMLGAQWKEALAEFDEAVRIQPQFAPFWVNIGAVYNATRQWQEAATACRRGLALAPESSKLLDQLGIALVNGGHPDQAVAAWRRAIQISPEDLESHVNLSTYLYQTGQLQEAADQLVVALKENPDAPNAYAAHFKLGYIYEKQGLWQAAADQYRTVSLLRPDFPELALRLRAVESHLSNP